MVAPSIARPLVALVALLSMLILGAAIVHASPALDAQADGLGAEVTLDPLPQVPALPAPGLPAGPEAGLSSLVLDSEALGAHAFRGALDGPMPLLLGPSPPIEATTAGPAPGSPSHGAIAAAPAEVAAAGAIAAAGALALKFEPVRRGLFLLALPLYSRLRRSELLENDVRERIYRAVERNPGLSIIQACRAAKVGWGTAVYHLQRLERDRMIASRRDGQYRRFFLNGQAPDPGREDPAARTLQHPLAQRIAAFVAANPGAAQKDVCAALAISPPLASKWLGRLLDAGLLTSQREWKLVRYAPTPRLAGALVDAAGAPGPRTLLEAGAAPPA